MPVLHSVPPHEDLRKLYWQDQKTSRQIAKTYGVHHITVLKWLTTYGIPRRHYRKRKANFSKTDLTYLYCDLGLTQKEIGKKYGVVQAMVSRRMLEWGIKTRSRSELVSGIHNPFYGKKHTEEEKEKERNSIYHRNLAGSKNPFYGKHHSEETLKKIMNARQIKPNKAELKFDSILANLTPDFRYNGDFRCGISIGGKIPDWVNVNGQKKVIELLGHGWHIQNKWFKVPQGKTKEEILKHYHNFGWRCLAVYDYELRNQSLLKDTILNFVEAT